MMDSLETSHTKKGPRASARASTALARRHRVLGATLAIASCFVTAHGQPTDPRPSRSAGGDFYAGRGSPSALTDVNGTLYFSARDRGNGVELWKSDGTAGGTSLVKADINAGPGSSTRSRLTSMRGTLFFVASDGPRFGLWKYTPAAKERVLVKGFTSMTGDSAPDFLTEMNVLFFAADDGGSGVECGRATEPRRGPFW
jgi:ELWxxDGT repeat protein